MNLPVVSLPDAFRPVETPLLRLGNEFDGGYVVSKAGLDHSNHLLSFGLCNDWTFEVDFLQRKGNQPDFGGIDAYDPTLTGWFLTKRTARYFGRRFRLKKISNMGTWSSYRSFFRLAQVRHHHHWIGKHAGSGNPIDSGRIRPTSDLVDCLFMVRDDARVYLKIDIEGSEYEILEQIAELSHRVSGISIEFHDFGESYLKHRDLFVALNEKFHVVHVHANNFGGIDRNNRPTVIEVSYIAKRLLKQVNSSTRHLPIDKLDMPNNRKAQDYRIQFEFSSAVGYRSAG